MRIISDGAKIAAKEMICCILLMVLAYFFISKKFMDKKQCIANPAFSIIYKLILIDTNIHKIYITEKMLHLASYMYAK